MKHLFESFQLGRIKIKNRIIMAPLTRSRAEGNLANDLVREYYSQRATAGLIITEGISPSPNGLGYARIPGLYSKEQIASWQPVTAAVHEKGGRIFAQIMHTGRATSTLNLPKGARVLAPSAIKLPGEVWTDQNGLQPYSAPEEMSLKDIEQAIQEYSDAAAGAIAAGFDGIELHAANGYLLEQFLNPKPNQRKDRYGGSPENRMRFVLELAKAAADRIGADRIGICISPYGVFNETGEFEGINEFYAELSRKLSDLGLAYIHIVDHSGMGAPAVNPEVKRLIRENFKQAYILSGGYTGEKAEQDLIENKGDLVAFGRPFISNPNLVEKLKTGAALTTPDHTTFYTPGPEGYTTYKA